MTETLLRQWTMLRLVPRHPRKITATDLQRQLAAQGYTTTERTVQRDLQSLSGELYALAVDDRNRPHGWYWSPCARPLDIPGMEPQTALAFHLARQFLEPMLAPPTLKALEPYFAQAETVMASTPEEIRAWPDKVRTVTRGQALIPPHIEDGILTAVSDALFRDQRLCAVYRRRRDNEPRDYRIDPLGLVFRDGVAYLVCTLFDYDDPIQLALHRMDQAEVLAEPVRRPAGFCLDAYLRQGGLDYRLGGAPLHLHLRLHPETAYHLRETPLSGNQELTDSPCGTAVELHASVEDTAQIRWWLLGLGSGVEVLAPAALREEIASTLRAAVDRYRD